MKYDLLCIDMFQTLIDIEARRQFIWERILKDKYHDYEMVMPLLKKYKFNEVFISEKVMSYKNDPNSKIFNSVLKHYSIEPSKILHIGDSLSDISRANRVGIKSCWINRENREWEYSSKPDYIVKSLNEVFDII